MAPLTCLPTKTIITTSEKRGSWRSGRIITAERVQSAQPDSFCTCSKKKKHRMPVRVIISSAALQSLTYRFKRLRCVGPLSPLNYEGNQPELNTDSTGITACHIRHPSVKITTSLPLCGELCHAMLTRCRAQDVCRRRGDKKKWCPCSSYNL